MKRLEGAEAIVAHDKDDFLRVYFEPQNFRKERKNVRWQFDCTAYLSIMPSWITGRKVEFVEEDKITETIIHEEYWYTFDEWVNEISKGNHLRLIEAVFRL